VTGQAINHIENIKSLSAEGLTRPEIAAKLDLCYEYVTRLARQADIEVPTKKQHSVSSIRELAEQGLTRGQISERTGLKYQTVSKLAFNAGIRIQRQDYSGAECADSDRIRQMADLYKSGRTLKQIGERFGVTRERVRQILTKHLGFNANSGGRHIRAERQRTRFELKRNQKCLEKWGCNWDQYVELRALRKPTRAFASQKQNASKRGIDWDLTLWQWWSIWQQSNHWNDRGRGHGFQMCRVGDQGAYSIDNVYIASGSVNIRDYWADVKSGVRTRTISPRGPGAALTDPKRAKELQRAAVARYQASPKYQLRYQLRRQGIPKHQRDAIVAERFGA
jgi:DNA-binding CsgD family transcriptional regulator